MASKLAEGFRRDCASVQQVGSDAMGQRERQVRHHADGAKLMSKDRHCNICGSKGTLKDRKCCKECFGIKKTIDDPYEICQAWMKKRPEKAAQYQAMADQHRQRLIETSVDPEREIRTNRRLAALAASTKPCKPRIVTTNGVESTCNYWRCGRCRCVLTKPTCLRCEMIIKGEIQDD
jgi:hypothetical protein